MVGFRHVKLNLQPVKTQSVGINRVSIVLINPGLNFFQM